MQRRTVLVVLELLELVLHARVRARLALLLQLRLAVLLVVEVRDARLPGGRSAHLGSVLIKCI